MVKQAITRRDPRNFLAILAAMQNVIPHVVSHITEGFESAGAALFDYLEDLLLGDLEQFLRFILLGIRLVGDFDSSVNEPAQAGFLVDDSGMVHHVTGRDHALLEPGDIVRPADLFQRVAPTHLIDEHERVDRLAFL